MPAKRKATPKPKDQSTAKIFMNGRSQAVRLPAAFRFPHEQVYIRRDPANGDVILSERPSEMSLQEIFDLLDASGEKLNIEELRDRRLPEDREWFHD